MSRQLFDDYVCVPIPFETYEKLIKRHGKRANGVIEFVVEDYLERTKDDHSSPPEQPTGLFWERVFLPENTKIRTKHHGQYMYAEVVADMIFYEGERFSSVSQAVKRMRKNVPANAWKVVELMRAQDSEWIHADSIRRRGV